jgi:hypothetical protein
MLRQRLIWPKGVLKEKQATVYQFDVVSIMGVQFTINVLVWNVPHRYRGAQLASNLNGTTFKSSDRRYELLYGDAGDD